MAFTKKSIIAKTLLVLLVALSASGKYIKRSAADADYLEQLEKDEAHAIANSPTELEKRSAKEMPDSEEDDDDNEDCKDENPIARVRCDYKGISVSANYKLSTGSFSVGGVENDKHCSKDFSENENITLFVPYGKCGVEKYKKDGVNKVDTFVVVNKKVDEKMSVGSNKLRISCTLPPTDDKAIAKYHLSKEVPETKVTATAPKKPTHTITVTKKYNTDSNPKPGDDMKATISIQPKGFYGVAKNCNYVKHADDPANKQVLLEVIDSDGCTTNGTIFNNWVWSDKEHALVTDFKAIQYLNESNVTFECELVYCEEPCPKPNCPQSDEPPRRCKNSHKYRNGRN